MRIRFSGLTRRPLVMALVVGGGMAFVAVNSFEVAPADLARLTLISLVVVLVLAIPAGLLVMAIKLIRHLRNRE